MQRPEQGSFLLDFVDEDNRAWEVQCYVDVYPPVLSNDREIPDDPPEIILDGYEARCMDGSEFNILFDEDYMISQPVFIEAALSSVDML